MGDMNDNYPIKN